MTTFWEAEVTITGVPSVTEDEAHKVFTVLSGALRHNAPMGTLTFRWRFDTDLSDITGAVAIAVATWRSAIRLIASAENPRCRDFRVREVGGPACLPGEHNVGSPA